jgi:chaperonin GroES
MEIDCCPAGQSWRWGRAHIFLVNQTVSSSWRVHNMKVRPLHDRIIVQRLEEGEQVVGGIIIPDTAKEKPQQGKVIAVGTGTVTDEGKDRPLALKKGDRILFGKYSGSEVQLDGEDFLIMKEEDVLGVLGA